MSVRRVQRSQMDGLTTMYRDWQKQSEQGETMTKDEALKLALEALTNAYWPTESDLMPAHNTKECADAITAIKEALAESEQEPLAWISTGPASMIHWTSDKPAYGDDWVPLYTAPPQRTWVGDLEDIDINITWNENSMRDFGKDELNFARSILRKAQEK